MSKSLLDQAKELLKNIESNPEALKAFQDLVKARAKESKHVEMEMSPKEDKQKRIDELSKRIKACMEKMQKESMDKDDKPHMPGTPEDKAHDVAEEGESVKEGLEGLKDKNPDSKEEMLSHLRSLKDKSQLRSPKNREVGKKPHEKAEEHEKGVHKPANFQIFRPGVSHAGISTRTAKINKEKGASNWQSLNEAKGRHKEIIAEQKKMPAAKLPKSELEKAKIDEGKTLSGKISSRQERNIRNVIETKTPSGQKTRTARSSIRREKELEEGKKPESLLSALKEHAERRKGEKIVGKPKTLENISGRDIRGKSAEQKTGVHMHSGSMAGKDLPIGVSAPVFADKEGKSYPVGGISSGVWGSKARHEEVMEGIKNINPKLPKSELEKEQIEPVKSPKPKAIMPTTSGMGDPKDGNGKKPKKPVKFDYKIPKIISKTEKKEQYYKDLVKAVIRGPWGGGPEKPGTVLHDEKQLPKLTQQPKELSFESILRAGRLRNPNHSTARILYNFAKNPDSSSETLNNVINHPDIFTVTPDDKGFNDIGYGDQILDHVARHKNSTNDILSKIVDKAINSDKEKNRYHLKPYLDAANVAIRNPNIKKDTIEKILSHNHNTPAFGDLKHETLKAVQKFYNKSEQYYRDLVKSTLEKADIYDFKTKKKLASLPSKETPKEGQPIMRGKNKGIATRKELKEKFSPDIMPEEKDVPGGTDTKKK